MLFLVPNSGEALRFAAWRGSLESVNLLIAHGATISKVSALHAAVEGGNVDIIKRLLELGVDVDEIDGIYTMGREVCYCPLLRAIKRGNIEAVRILLDNGASTRKAGKEDKNALEMVKRDWVKSEIRKMVEEVGERGGDWEDGVDRKIIIG